MFLYNLVVRLYGFLIRLASINNSKARQWIAGRRNWKKNLEAKIARVGSGKRIWIHCASYGEFEQGRTLIETVRNDHPEYKIILTFFSPSGYKAFKNWEGADVICYLPLDTKSNAREFVRIVAPNLVIFIKYEFWVNYLFQLKKQNIPIYLVSAVFKRHHPFFKWWGELFRKSLQTFTTLFIQDDYSAKLLKEIRVKNYQVIGDTRFDRVLEVRENFSEIDEIKKFKGGSKLIVAGSTWQKDDNLVIKAFEQLKNENVKLLLVPHDIGEKFIVKATTLLDKAQLSYSLFTGTINYHADVLVLNTMGLLSKTYFYADCAYIGGGFSGGLHNCLEAAVYGVPVTFYGDSYSKYNEVFSLLNMKAAINVLNEEELAKAFKYYLSDDPKVIETKRKLKVYFEDNSNITKRILEYIEF